MRAATRVLAALILLGSAGPALAQNQPADATIRRALDEIRRDIGEISLPDAPALTRGARTIAAGERVTGPIVVWNGDLDILGTVAGDVIVVDGDVIVGDGGRVEGDVLSVRGTTRIRGVVTGSVMRLEGNLSPTTVTDRGPPASTVWHSIGVTLATFAIFLVLGVGVLIFAGPTLEGVAEALDRHLARSFLIGVAGQLGLIPGLLVLVVALGITLIGLLLIPFAIVAYVLAVSGALTLAFLTVALVIGRAVGLRRPDTTLARRAAALRAMLIGVSTLFVLWVVAALLGWSPLAAGIVRLIALVTTWVAVSAGFGAVLTSRAGTRRAEPVTSRPVIPDEVAWQTPTPVSGVAAARRPTPVAGATGGGRR
jgi:hypothetical protein